MLEMYRRLDRMAFNSWVALRFGLVPGEYEFEVDVEVKTPRSWIRANGING